MLAWRSWFDLRVRFYCSLAMLLLLLTLLIATYPLLSNLNVANPTGTRVRLVIHDYSNYVYQLWFGGYAAAVLYIMTITMSLGVIPGEKKSGAVLVTLSLPVRRWVWPAAHTAMTSFLILVLTILSPIFVATASHLIKESYSLQGMLVIVIGGWLLCYPWMGLSLLLNSFVRNRTLCALIIIPVNLFSPKLVQDLAPGIYRWSPWQMATPGVWDHSVPWVSILVSLFIGSGGVALATLRFTREEF